MSSSSDSSDDEDLQKFAESIDNQLINDSMFKEEKKPKVEVQQLPSLRPKINDYENEESGFEAHAAKHLTKLLNNYLEEYQAPSSEFQEKKPKRRKGGIKLFSDSEYFLKPEKIEHLQSQPPQKRIQRDIEQTKEDLQKIREVVVEPSDILSKKEVKNWSNRSKAPIYYYKKTPKGLVEIEKPFK